VAFDLLLAICSAAAFGLMTVRQTTLETAAAGDRSLSHAYFAELTISAPAHLALSFLNGVAATSREWRRPTG
jgi:hypothetical protein